VRDAAIITPSDISRLNPALGNVESVGGAFCPTDGFIRPLAILEGYQQAAERLGVEFRFGEACTGVLTGSGRVIGVETSLGTIATEHIVNAAGAWAGIVARYGGVELPVTPARRQVAIIEARGLLPENMPMTIFLEDGFHLRVRDGYALLLWPDGLLDPDSFDLAFDDGWLRGVVERARIRVPCLADAAINRRRSWAGLYEMSPDKHAILGSAPGLDGLFLVNGSSGHGVMHSPALGLLASEMILQGRPVSLDVHSLRPGRFAEGAPNRGSSLL
jgi:sarcosine oxidase subunit beta